MSNSIFNINVFGGSLQGAGSFVNGIYYSRIFQKPTANSWYNLSWTSNINVDTTNISLNTYGLFNVQMRVRVGDNLPYDYVNKKYMDLSTVNSLIPSDTPEQIDALLYRWTVGRSTISVNDSAVVSPSNSFTLGAGTALNYSRLSGALDANWSYWSLPISLSPSYIPHNTDFNYLQLRIDLNNSGSIVDPNTSLAHFAEIYSVTISSILSQN